MTILFLSLWIFAAGYGLLFYALYFFVVLLRINDEQVRVQRPGILFRQQRYIERYLGLLTNDEKLRWYNVLLKHSFVISLVLSTAFLFTVVAMAVRDLR